MTHMSTRRELLALLGAGTLYAQRSPPEFAALDHIEFYVSNLDKSRDFFARLFGNTLLKNSSASKKYLKLGSSYMAFAVGPISVDHFSCSIKNVDMAKVHAHLEAQGIPYRDYPSGRDTAVLDPDGTRTQLSPENGWSLFAPPNFTPESYAMTQEPIFKPTGIEHILLNVSDPEKAAAFYEKIFGPVTLRNNNRIWFQVGASRLGLLKTPEGQKAGVNHYGVQAVAFDYDDVVKKLLAMGAKVEPAEVAGAPSFRDPDGALLQVVGPRA
jgi:catechol 2,3-dioxygenase-like lactoylglutathione lyase family enzyme